MQLRDTIPLMISDDYKERLRAEYYQLKNRTDKLMTMLKQWDNRLLPFTPTCPRILLDDQLKSMLTYLSILSLRAQLEGINLTEE